MGENGFEVVRLRVRAQSLRRRGRCQRVAQIETNIGIQNLADFRGDGTAADLDANAVGGYHARESQRSGIEGHVRLIKAYGIDAVRPTGIRRRDAHQRHERSESQCCTLHAGPHVAGLLPSAVLQPRSGPAGNAGGLAHIRDDSSLQIVRCVFAEGATSESRRRTANKKREVDTLTNSRFTASSR